MAMQSGSGGQEFFTSQIGKFLLGRILGMPPSLCNFKTIDDIDALIDISGFAFSEQWGTKKTLDFLKLAQYYKRQGKPVILLPQAFGPFTNQLIREKIRAIIDVSTLTFVRDDQSYQYLKDANVPASKLIKSPDITISYARHP
jgi:polysaccharide pyruvyl transferase WcaK-like protein